jgi:hypothetical protein
MSDPLLGRMDGNNFGRAWRLVGRLGLEENATPAARRRA